MHGGNAGRTEAGVVVLRPVQRTRPPALSFHVPVEGEWVGRQTKVARRPNHRSSKHLWNVVLFIGERTVSRWFTCMGGGCPPCILGTIGETPGSRGVADACPPLPSSPLT